MPDDPSDSRPAAADSPDPSSPAGKSDAATGAADAKAARPKVVFFSYPHGEDEELVRLFVDALSRRGHKVLTDWMFIKDWDDWRGRITACIHQSQLAVAFLSAHALREGGVCRNEIAIASNRLGVVYAMLLERGIEDSIPPPLRDLQWPDLSGWKDIRAGKVPGVEWSGWYARRLKDTIDKLEGEEAGELVSEFQALLQVLRPATFESRFAQHLPDFVGRDWVFEAYDDWLLRVPQSRLLRIEGGPGMGKTALAVQLASRRRDSVLASWFCQIGSSELGRPEALLRGIAFQLAFRLPDYRKELMSGLGITGDSESRQLDEARRELRRMSVVDLFSTLLSEPLADLHAERAGGVVLIDALDEASAPAGSNAIADLLGSGAGELPPWLRFVVTSRPEAGVRSLLQGFKTLPLQPADPRNAADLQACYRRLLEQHEGLDAATRDALQRHEPALIDRSQGMILYLQLVFEGLREGSLRAQDLDSLAPGVPGLYSRYASGFNRRLPDDAEFQRVAPLLRLLVAAPGPLPKDMARSVLDCNGEELASRIRRLGSYLVDDADGLRLFHASLAQWLGTEQDNRYYLDADVGRRQLAAWLWKRRLELRGDGASEPTFARDARLLVDWLPRLVEVLPAWDDPVALLGLAEHLADLGCDNQPLAAVWRRVSGLAREHRDTPLQARALDELALLALAAGDAEAAARHADQGLELLQDQGLEDTLRHGMLLRTRGRVLAAQGRQQDALERFGEAIEQIRAAERKAGVLWGAQTAAAIFDACGAAAAVADAAFGAWSVGRGELSDWLDARKQASDCFSWLSAIYTARDLHAELALDGKRAPQAQRWCAAHDAALAQAAAAIYAGGERVDQATLARACEVLDKEQRVWEPDSAWADAARAARTRWVHGMLLALRGQREPAQAELDSALQALRRLRNESHGEVQAVARLLQALRDPVDQGPALPIEEAMRALSHGWMNQDIVH